MSREELLGLAILVEDAPEPDDALAARAAQGLAEAFPAAAAAGLVSPAAMRSTDALLALVSTALPGWHYSIRGRARPAGSWALSLRRSDVLDDDEILGTGEADRLPSALLAALLRIAAWD